MFEENNKKYDVLLFVIGSLLYGLLLIYYIFINSDLSTKYLAFLLPIPAILQAISVLFHRNRLDNNRLSTVLKEDGINRDDIFAIEWATRPWVFTEIFDVIAMISIVIGAFSSFMLNRTNHTLDFRLFIVCMVLSAILVGISDYKMNTKRYLKSRRESIWLNTLMGHNK